MEQFFKSIWEFMQSPEFTGMLASIWGVYLIVRPIINKVLSLKSNRLIEAAKLKYTAAQGSVAELSAEVTEYKQAISEMKELITGFVNNANSQNKALRLAFDRSNLTESVKKEIAALLPENPLPALTAQITAIKEAMPAKAAEIKEAVAEKVEAVKTAAVEAVDIMKNSVSGIIRKFD